MQTTYSIYDAKTRLSEIIRQVREHKTGVTITYHGKPVAEIRPVEEPDSSEDPMEARVRELIASGELIPATRRLHLRPVAKVPGALQRFLEERHRF